MSLVLHYLEYHIPSLRFLSFEKKAEGGGVEEGEEEVSRLGVMISGGFCHGRGSSGGAMMIGLDMEALFGEVIRAPIWLPLDHRVSTFSRSRGGREGVPEGRMPLEEEEHKTHHPDDKRRKNFVVRSRAVVVVGDDG